MITDHVAILLHASLDQARINRLKPTKPATYFAQFAFPPAAGNDLHQLCTAVAPGGSLAGLDVGVHIHSSMAKPIPGIPANWLIVRASTQYAPTLFNMQGQNVESEQAIRALFYPGRRVRAAISTFPWAHESGKKGISFNLQGVMDAGPGERLSIGNGVVVNAFTAHAQPAGAAAEQPANPFGGAAPSPAPASSAPANPFAGTVAAGASTIAAAGNNNPFAQ